MQAIGADEFDVTCLAARTVAGEMRQRIEYRLSAMGLTNIAHDTCLVAAELITNACHATPGGKIRFRFVREVNAILLAVWDSGDLMPQVQPIRELEPADLDLSPEGFDNNGGWGWHWYARSRPNAACAGPRRGRRAVGHRGAA